MDYETGSVVKSTAGRDKGKLLVVIETGQDCVIVCDGRERPLERPKRKNPRHLEQTGLSLTPGQTATNRALRKALGGLQQQVCNGKP